MHSVYKWCTLPQYEHSQYESWTLKVWILYTHCVNSMHSMCRRCTFSVWKLYIVLSESLCTLTVWIIYTSVWMLCTHCINHVHPCVNPLHSLYESCTLSVWILYTHCMNPVHWLHEWMLYIQCINHVHSLCESCTLSLSMMCTPSVNSVNQCVSCTLTVWIL